MKKLLIITLLALISCSAKLGKMEEKSTIMDAIRRGEDIQIINQTIDETIDFTALLSQILIGEVTSNGKCGSSISFIGCTFKKPLIGYSQSDDKTREATTTFMGNVSFVNCLFEDKVNFKSCTIYGKTDFSKSIFSKGAVFEDMTYMQAANFRHIRTNNEARFQNTRFYHKSNFMDMVISGNISFQSAKFGDDTNFSVTEAQKHVDFSLARFDGTAQFNYIKWTDRITFNNALFNMNTSFIKPVLGNVSFKNTVGRMDFRMVDKDSGDITNPLNQ